MPEYCFGGGAATRERQSHEGFSSCDEAARESLGLVLILLAAPPPIFLAGLPHKAFNALIRPATQAN